MAFIQSNGNWKPSYTHFKCKLLPKGGKGVNGKLEKTYILNNFFCEGFPKEHIAGEGIDKALSGFFKAFVSP